jgi:hypothetical protein
MPATDGTTSLNAENTPVKNSSGDTYSGIFTLINSRIDLMASYFRLPVCFEHSRDPAPVVDGPGADALTNHSRVTYGGVACLKIKMDWGSGAFEQEFDTFQDVYLKGWSWGTGGSDHFVNGWYQVKGWELPYLYLPLLECGHTDPGAGNPNPTWAGTVELPKFPSVETFEFTLQYPMTACGVPNAYLISADVMVGVDDYNYELFPYCVPTTEWQARAKRAGTFWVKTAPGNSETTIRYEGQVRVVVP